MPDNEIYRKIYSSIEELPTIPVVTVKLVKAFEDKNYNAASIAKLISSDASLTSKILKIANSAYYGFQRQVSSLQYAVALLGFNMVKSLALSLGVITSLPDSPGSRFFNPEKLWLHNIAAATVMESIRTKVKGVPQESPLFVIGILHDTGKIVLDQFFNEKFAAVLESLNTDTSQELHIKEKSIIGLDHCEVGAMLFQRWHFPENIVTPIKLHHSRERFDSPLGVEISILRIGNIIPQQVGMGSDGNAVPPEISGYDLENTGLSEKEIETLRQELMEKQEGIKAFLS
ncbi:MAG: HDOD domain-containing protein [Desulfobacteraceae bacterium]